MVSKYGLELNKNYIKTLNQPALHRLIAELCHPGLINSYTPMRMLRGGRDLRLIKHANGYSIAESIGKELHIISREDAVQMIARAYAFVLPELTKSNYLKILTNLISIATALDDKAEQMGVDERLIIHEHEVKGLLFKSDEGWCWKRLNFDLKEGEIGGGWRSIIDNISLNRDAFMAFIGSLFDISGHKDKYLWLYGIGGSGKSTITQFLLNVFGDAATAVSETLLKSKHFSSNLVGKRLCVIKEAPAWVTLSPMIKELTGDGVFVVDEKYGYQKKVNLNTKFVMASNVIPDLVNTNSILRRCLLVRTSMAIDPSKKIPMEEMQEILMREAPTFLHACISMYLKDKTLETTIDIKSSEFVSEVTIDDGNPMLKEHAKWLNKFDFLPGAITAISEIRGLFYKYQGTNYQMMRFLKFVQERFEVVPGRTTNARYYRGIRIKPEILSTVSIKRVNKMKRTETALERRKKLKEIMARKLDQNEKHRIYMQKRRKAELKNMQALLEEIV